MQPYIISQYLSAAQLHPITVDWSNRVVSNGGAIPTRNTLVAANRFLNTLIDKNLTGKMRIVNIIPPDSLTAMRTPFINTSGSGFWGNTNFVASDLTLNGIKGAANKSFNLAVKPNSIVTSGNAGLVCYIYSGFNSATNVEIGSVDAGGTNALRLTCGYNSNQAWWSMWGNEGSQTINTVAKCSGYFGGFRTSNTRFDGYHASPSSGHAVRIVNTNASNFNPPSVRDIVFMATNENGTINQSSQKIVSFMAVTLGLTSGESSDFYNAIQQLRQDIGGGFV